MAEPEQQNQVYQLARMRTADGEEHTNVLVIVTKNAENPAASQNKQIIVLKQDASDSNDEQTIVVQPNRQAVTPKKTIIVRPSSSRTTGQSLVVRPNSAARTAGQAFIVRPSSQGSQTQVVQTSTATSTNSQVYVVNPDEAATANQTIVVQSSDDVTPDQTIVIQPHNVEDESRQMMIDGFSAENIMLESLDEESPEYQDVSVQTNSTKIVYHKVMPNKTFKCLICGKELSNSSILKRHIRIHTGVRPYQCSLCNKRFTQSNDLTAHMRSHTGSRPFKCEVCGKGFTQRQNVKKHMLVHTGEKNYECDICNKRFSRKHHMLEHRRIHVGPEIKCGVCFKGFTAKGHLRRHYQKYHPKSDEASVFYSNTHDDDLAKQMETETETIQQEVNFVADEENVETATVEIGGSVETCNDPLAQLAFNTLENTKDEQTTVTTEILYRCDLCEKQFKDLSFLERHLRLHLEGKLFSCTICNKVFNYKGLLKRHMVVHTKEKPYECTQCNKRFTQSNDLKIHARLHTGQKPFKCEFCPSSFNQRQQLKNHRRKHTGERPFRCSICEKRFSRMDHAKAHEKTHKNDHLKCQICAFTARNPNSLQKHMKKHDNLDTVAPTAGQPLNIDNPNLRCKYCMKNFKDLTRLRKHELDHEKSKLFNCKVCNQVYYREETFKLHCQLHENSTILENGNIAMEYKEVKVKKDEFVGTMIKIELEEESNENEDENMRNDDGEGGDEEENNANGDDENNDGEGEENEGQEQRPVDQGNSTMYCCSHCGAMLPWDADLVKHMETHLPTNPGERPSDVTKTGIVQTTPDGKYLCSICGRHFTNLIALQSHIKNIHNMDISDYELNYKESEGIMMTQEDIQHIEKQIQENLRFTGCYSVMKNSAKKWNKRYSDDRPMWQCEICAKVVKRKENLERHRKLHKVLHKCNICHKVFKQKNHLDTHWLIKHDGNDSESATNPEFACDQPGCNKYFSKKFNLQRHKLWHKKQDVMNSIKEESIMVYECRGCKEAFSSCEELQEHIDTFHETSAKDSPEKKLVQVEHSEPEEKVVDERTPEQQREDEQAATEAALRLVLEAVEGIPEENSEPLHQQVIEIVNDDIEGDQTGQYREVIIQIPQGVDGSGDNTGTIYSIVTEGDDGKSMYVTQNIVTTATTDNDGVTQTIITRDTDDDDDIVTHNIPIENVQTVCHDLTESDNSAAIAMVELSGDTTQYDHSYGQ